MADTLKIQTILKNLPTEKLEGLKRLFWEELNYDHANQSVPTRGWDAALHDNLGEDPVLFATAGTGDGFHILYCRLNTEKMTISAERALINKLIIDHPHSLFIFSNLSQNHWHFVNAVHERDEQAHRRRVLRRISVSPEDRLRTASERIACLDTVLAKADLFGLDPFSLQKQHEEAFDVEAVTEEFFEDYKKIFTLLTNDLAVQTKDQVWAHDFALQFMNRLMFLYYIERKRWLGNDPDFLHNFWRAYRRAEQPKDSFVSHWLNLLFFNAFNKPKAPAVASAAHIPEEFRSALLLAPWLNGGLFAENKLDTEHPYLICDNLIKDVFDFLDQYNFTISEDTPLDQEVAVDPEMIGKVYESLVNVSSEADEKGDAGIFYTPRIEIDLMSRLSLVDWLRNHLADVHYSVLYEFVFAFNPEDKAAADRRLTELNLWPVVNRLLRSVTVLDPACGSGSFLVGTLMILDDLLSRCAAVLGGDETSYERRKSIVASSLYGVDIMEWAVHVAELRLWLQLVIDTDLDENELRLRPLLPNLSFKVRKGDSLVQEIGGLNFSLRRAGGQLPAKIAGKITALKGDKLDYFNNKEDRRYKTREDVEQAERVLFREIIEDEIIRKRKRLAELDTALNPASNLFGEVQQTQMSIDAVAKKRERDQVNEAISKLEPALEVLKTTKDIPFVWDVSFVEIFEGDKGGFDIVLGNPPYIRQEKIRDPGLLAEAVTDENKKAYKAKLAQMVYATYPATFAYNPATRQAGWSLDKKSDYYIYFYFLCLALLNDKGSFCFITSNSWLDVGYGSDLQRFLLTRGKVKLIIDNQVKRSFKSADVNTIIALLAPPQDNRNDLKASLAHEARFVMFQVPFENGLSPVLWEEVEEAEGRRTTLETRVVVKKQAELLETGIDAEKGVYAGDKWGGKYLRAPDIYWVIMEKCRDKLVRLGDVADIRRGITTGATDFFFLSKDQIDEYGFEEDFYKPIYTTLKDIDKYLITGDMANKYVFSCDFSKKQLKEKNFINVLNYIEAGESLGLHKRPSIRAKNPWYSISEQKQPQFIINRFLGERFGIPLVSNVLISDVFFVGTFNDEYSMFGPALLNNSITYLTMEILARKAYALGVAYVYGPECNSLSLVNPEIIPDDIKQEVVKNFSIMCTRNILKIENELDLTDRIDFDKVIFRYLGLSDIEQDQLYEDIINMTMTRLGKAKN